MRLQETANGKQLLCRHVSATKTNGNVTVSEQNTIYTFNTVRNLRVRQNTAATHRAVYRTITVQRNHAARTDHAMILPPLQPSGFKFLSFAAAGTKRPCN